MTIDDVMRRIAQHIDFVVHVSLQDDASRGGAVRQLTCAMDAGRPATHLVYRHGGEPQADLFQPEADGPGGSSVSPVVPSYPNPADKAVSCA